MEKRKCLTKNSLTALTKKGSTATAPQHCVRSEFVCWWCVQECVNCHFIKWWGIAQSARRIKQRREENNLDSDYQPALMQEEGNISMATETTSQCHVTMVAVSQQTSGSRSAPACWAACTSPCGCSPNANYHPIPMVGKHKVLTRHNLGTIGSTGPKSELQLDMTTIVSLPGSV